MLSLDLTLIASLTIVSMTVLCFRLANALVTQNRELSNLLRERESIKFLK